MSLDRIYTLHPGTASVSAVARKSVIPDGTSTTTCRGCMSEHRRQEPVWTSVRGAGVTSRVVASSHLVRARSTLRSRVGRPGGIRCGRFRSRTARCRVLRPARRDSASELLPRRRRAARPGRGSSCSSSSSCRPRSLRPLHYRARGRGRACRGRRLRSGPRDECRPRCCTDVCKRLNPRGLLVIVKLGTTFRPTLRLEPWLRAGSPDRSAHVACRELLGAHRCRTGAPPRSSRASGCGATLLAGFFGRLARPAADIDLRRVQSFFSSVCGL